MQGQLKGTAIDMICVRQEQADAVARLSTVLSDFPVKAHMICHYHRPLVATLPWTAPHTTWRRARPSLPLSRFCILQQLEIDPHLAGRFRDELQRRWVPDVPTAQWDRTLCEAWQAVAPPCSTQRPKAAWDQPRIQGTFEKMWVARRAYQSPGEGHRNGVFQAWKHMAQYRKLRKQLQQQSRARHQQRTDAVLQTANEALQAGHFNALYRSIQHLAPKRTGGRVQIRSVSGALLSPQEELQEIRDFYADVYAEHAEHCPRVLPSSICFDVQEVQTAMEALPPSKALAPSSAPAPLWRLAAAVMAPQVAQVYNDIGTAHRPVQMDEDWTFANVCLIPKKRTSSRCGDYRPISLLHPRSWRVY